MGGVALVTGAGSGLGRGIARRLSAAGLSVALLGRREDKLRETAEGCADALVVPTDVRDPVQVRAALDAVTARWGRLDLVVNNAALLADAADQSVDPWDYFSCVLRTNVLGPALVTEEAVRHLKPGGLVVHIGSSVADVPTPNALAYGASKAALAHLTASQAVRYAPRRLRVVAIAPGALHRDEGREVTVADGVAETIIFLSSRWGRHFQGTVLRLDEGEVPMGFGS